MQYCRRCLYPANHPLGITFDAEGICSGCRVHEEKDSLDWTERSGRLARLLEGYRGRNRSRHDCIIPVSGGRDSFYIVHLARKVYGLNPLLVVYNRHYNTRAGIYNIARLRTALGCDIVTLTLAPDLVRRVMRATIPRLGSFHWHAIAGHTVFPVQMAVRMNIPLVIWGAHQGLEQVGMFSHLDEVEMTRRYRREHDLMGCEAEDLIGDADLTQQDLQPFLYPDDASLLRTGVRGIYLGNYHRWDTKAQHEQMLDLYGYYTGPLARTFDHYNDVDDRHYAGLHDVIKYRKFGYGLATDHASREIRFGRLTREQGLKLAHSFAAQPAADAAALAEFSGLTEAEIYAAVDRYRDLRVWEKSGEDWRLRSTPAGGETVGRDPACVFRDNRPDDFEGAAEAGQLLTRGYAKE